MANFISKLNHKRTASSKSCDQPHLTNPLEVQIIRQLQWHPTPNTHLDEIIIKDNAEDTAVKPTSHQPPTQTQAIYPNVPLRSLPTPTTHRSFSPVKYPFRLHDYCNHYPKTFPKTPFTNTHTLSAVCAFPHFFPLQTRNSRPVPAPRHLQAQGPQPESGKTLPARL